MNKAVIIIESGDVQTLRSFADRCEEIKDDNPDFQEELNFTYCEEV